MSGPSGEIPNFSDICEDVKQELSKVELGVAVGAAVEGVRFGMRGSMRGGETFPYLGIGAAVGMVLGEVIAAAAGAGYSFNVPSFIASCKYQRLFFPALND